MRRSLSTAIETMRIRERARVGFKGFMGKTGPTRFSTISLFSNFEVIIFYFFFFFNPNIFGC